MTQRLINLTPRALESLIEDSRAGELVGQLGLVGIHDEDGERRLSEAPATRQELIRLLTQAFNGLVQNGNSPSLHLDLRIDSVGPIKSSHQIKIMTELEEWSTSRSAYQCSVDTFFVAIEALAASKLQIETFNIFNDDEMKLFALLSDQLGAVDWNRPDIAHSLAALKGLCVNISTPAYSFRQVDGQGGAPDWLGRVTEFTASQILEEIEKEYNFDGLPKMIQKCPLLGSFEFRWLGIPLPGLKELQGFKFPGWKILHLLTQSPHLPRLLRVDLKHHITKEIDVLEFIKRTKPIHLYIGPMWLDSGQYRLIFDYCNSKEAEIEVFVARGPLYQLAPEQGQVHFQRQGYNEEKLCSPHLQRDEDGLRRPIHFHLDTQGFVEAGSTYCNVVLGPNVAKTF
ncbi:hypothetical protein FGRMN_1683 [Fusarium graminum]|nr:hypothetical protein FGRMN_1683 [Fusarium graminum]